MSKPLRDSAPSLRVPPPLRSSVTAPPHPSTTKTKKKKNIYIRAPKVGPTTSSFQSNAWGSAVVFLVVLLVVFGSGGDVDLTSYWW